MQELKVYYNMYSVICSETGVSKWVKLEKKYISRKSKNKSNTEYFALFVVTFYLY